MKDHAVEKNGHVAAHTRAPVQTIHVDVDLVADPARERRSLDEAVIDVDGRPVPAHVAAGQPDETVDLLADRLRGRLDELADRFRSRHHARSTGRPDTSGATGTCPPRGRSTFHGRLRA